MRKRGVVVSIENPRTWQAAGSTGDAVLEYLDGLYRFALRLTRDPSQAEELTQETIARALEQRNAPLLSLRSWLFRTLFHTFVDHCRRGRRQGASHEDSLDEAETDNRVDLVPSLIASKDVRNAIGHLPEEFRAVIWLSDAEGFRIREIADILDCPVGTVASRLARSRRELRRLLSAYRPPGEKPI